MNDKIEAYRTFLRDVQDSPAYARATAKHSFQAALARPMKERQVSTRKLAALSGVPEADLRSFLRFCNAKPLTLDAMADLARALGCLVKVTLVPRQ